MYLVFPPFFFLLRWLGPNGTTHGVAFGKMQRDNGKGPGKNCPRQILLAEMGKLWQSAQVGASGSFSPGFAEAILYYFTYIAIFDNQGLFVLFCRSCRSRTSYP